MITFALLIASQFVVALLGYLVSKIIIGKARPTKPLTIVLLGFAAMVGFVSVMVIG